MPDRKPLPKDQLAAEFERFECWVRVTKELGLAIEHSGLFPSASRGQRTFLFSSHRVGPRKLFSIPKEAGFPSEYEIDQARNESLRCAQRKALELLKIEGVTSVRIASVSRKEASTRFTRGRVKTDFVAEMKSPADRFIDGEPSDRAWAINLGLDPDSV